MNAPATVYLVTNRINGDTYIGVTRFGKEIIDKSRIKKQKAVECIDLNCVFDSVLEAAEMTGVHFSSISRVCLGKRTKAGGMKFQFAQGEYHQ